MKCGGMICPCASFTKPESIGCWISACTSVVSPVAVARTRMVDAMMCFLYALAAAAADGDLHFLGRAEQLAAGFHDRDHVAGLGHLEPVRNARQRAFWDHIGCRQRIRILADEERDRGDAGQRGR